MKKEVTGQIRMIVIKYFIFIFVSTLFCSKLIAQQKILSMETANEVFENPDTKTLISYIDSLFDAYQFNRKELHEENHSLSDVVFNMRRKLKPHPQLMIFGFEIADAYAYKSDTSNLFAIYFLFKLTRNIANEFAKKWGEPINATYEEINNLDFDGLIWRIGDGLFIELIPDYSKNYELSERENCILTITNMNGMERLVSRQ